jgi:hypothetical protein
LGNYSGLGVGGVSLLQIEVAVAGPFAAYALSLEAERYQGQGFTEAIDRLNVKTGKRERLDAEAAFGSKSPGITDVVVTPAGSVAWMIEGSFQDPTGQTPAPGVVPLGSKAIFDVSPTSKVPVLVAFSTTIQPKSLAVTAGHLYWLEGEAAHTAAIQ